MKERINNSIVLLYEFIRNPFEKPINNLESDKDLVFLASFLAGITMIVMGLSQSSSINDSSIILIYIITGLIICPLFGLLTVHFRGAIYFLFLKYICSPIFKIEAENVLYAKQIQTFSTIGLIVSAVPSLSNVGIIISLIIEIIGLFKLYKIDLLKSAIIGLIYRGTWWGLIYLIARETVWL